MNVYIPYTAILPSAYQEVEYIQSTGNQYIDTGYNYNGTYFRIDIQLMFNSYSYGGTGADCPFICGVIGRSYGNMFMSVGANNRVFGISTGTEMGTSLPVQLGTRYDTMLEYKSGTMTFKSNDSTVTTSSTGTFYTGKSIPLFCRWDIQYSGLYSYFCTDMRMYGCKIYSAENVLARDFVPCYRKSDNVIGLYDLVNNQFYTNAGSGTFSKGNDVTMTVLKNAYIGEYKGFEYSYDFSNKTLAGMQSDGWTFSSTSNWSFSSNGIDCSAQQRAFLNLGTILSNAKKITIENVYVVSNTNRSRGVRFCTSSSSYGNPAGHYWSGVENDTRIDIPGYAKSISQYSSTGTKTCKVVLDLLNKTGVLSYTGLPDINQTFDDTAVTTIRSYPTLQLFFSVGTGAPVKSVNITVEY